MTTAHTQFNYNRRNSVTTSQPYTIPSKHQIHSQSPHGHLPPGHHQTHQNHHHQIHPGHHQHKHRSISHGHQTRPIFKSEPGTNNEAVIEDGDMMSSSVPTLSREFVVRRISEGETGRLKEELKCEACGKGYKHVSSLAKHLWEHTPEWNVTKKLLISKHQQVQLLEAASILVGMNDEDNGSRRNSVFNEEDIHKYGDRKNSISQDPPNLTNSVPKSVHFVTGGYLDVKEKYKSRSNSIDNSPGVNSPIVSPRRDSPDEDIIGHME